MSYFRERNNIQTEYSGYQKASEGLRNRLYAVMQRYSSMASSYGEPRHVSRSQLNHDMQVRLGKGYTEAIGNGSYDEVFEATEIFLTLANHGISLGVREQIFMDIMTAFLTAGSVYSLDNQGQVILQVSEETAKNIQSTEEAMTARSEKALDFFRRALRGLLARESTPNDVVKDFALAMQEYVKVLTNKKDYKEALKNLQEQGKIAATQKEVLTKLYAYRGDADGVVHPGNTTEPDEVDAIWFLETLVAQIKLIEVRVKEQEK